MKQIGKRTEEISRASDIFSERITHHAKRRKAQRGFGINDLVAVIMFGQEFIQKTGSTAYYFSKKSLERKEIKKQKTNFSDLVGIAVILSENSEIITAFKNKNLKNITKRLRKN